MANRKAFSSTVIYSKRILLTKGFQWNQRQFSSTIHKSSNTDAKPSVMPLNSHLEILNAYFDNNIFDFVPEKKERQISDLRNWMEWVYLRESPLVAIDVEAWEKNTRKVTEIGIAVYDPSESCNSIFPLIRPFHIIVSEHKKMFNGRYVPDNKHKYMGGKSHELTLDEGKNFVKAILQKFLLERKGVLVGHHIEGDIKWLRSLGVSFPEDLRIVDTAKLYRLTKSSGGTLRGILRLVDIPHGHLHNAANDAYYTLLATLAYCDPNFRRDKKLDYFIPETNKGMSTPNKSFKRLQRLYDNSEVAISSDGNKLFEQLFQETISNSSKLEQESISSNEAK